MPVSIQIQRFVLWKFVGCVSAVVGLLCYALSSSFNHLFGEWNFFKIFLFVISSFIILTLVAKVWPFLTNKLFETRRPFLVLMATSVYSFFYDKAVNKKPDVYIVISCAAFAVMCLSLSKQTKYGYEKELQNFFYGLLIVLLMKINLWLFFVGAGFSCSLFTLGSCSNITPTSNHFELLQDRLVIQVQDDSNSAIQVYSQQDDSNNNSAIQVHSPQTNTPTAPPTMAVNVFPSAHEHDFRLSNNSHGFIPNKNYKRMVQYTRLPPNENYEEIKSLSRMESRGVRTIGMWGMGGVGKTAIAKVIFQQVSSEYRNASEVSSRLFSDLLMEDVNIDTPKVIASTAIDTPKVIASTAIDTPKVIASTAMSRLKGNKVCRARRHEFFGTYRKFDVRQDWLRVGSKVIVTAGDKHVVRSRVVDKIHEMRTMSFPASIQLFSFNAFNKPHPEEGYEELSKRTVLYAKGFPFELKVLGLFLHSKSQNEWKSALAKLEKLSITKKRN